jgi:PIN domain nuclease of toxin-antitoxin system
MTKIVVDSSAVLAALHKEPGGETVLARLDQAVISSVNFAEVVSKLSRTGADITQVLSDLQDLIPDIRPFDAEAALVVGLLDSRTKALGLSLGDRACLALAQSLGVPVLTADQVWLQLDLGLEIVMIRNSSYLSGSTPAEQ